MKIVTVLGARPQFIKASVVSKELIKNSIEEVIIHTGQHFNENMSKIFFDEMGIPKPKYNLDINSLTHGAMTGRMLEKIENILQDEKPNFVIVYGDTNSTLAGALSAKKLHIKVIHIEAGLRSHNMMMPEEINRILTDRISDVLFCPSSDAVANLNKENIIENVFNVGDVMKDVALHYKVFAKKPTVTLSKEYILMTLHRQENTDSIEKMKTIAKAINKISEKVEIVFPIHPRTKKILEKNSINFDVNMIDPVGYLEMVYLLNSCNFVITDSGGLQKEAFFFEKQCITLREETEWIELVEANVNILAGADYERIYNAYQYIINNVKNIKFDQQFYGDGNSSSKIINVIKKLC